MRKLITWMGLLSIFLGVYLARDELVEYIYNVVRGNVEVSLNFSNKYTRKYDYTYLSFTDNFNVSNKTELLNVYYTILNSGVDKFSFYCKKEYENCISDVINLANDQDSISTLNSFVHPYNSFDNIQTSYDILGKVTLNINKTYSEKQIEEINKKVQEIKDKYIKDITDEKTIIKIVHDYIIDTTVYDSDRSDKNIVKYASNIAYGPLIEGYGICGGYTDAMAIFLDIYGIPNMSIISEEHIWNGVYIDGKWQHLDLTWNDPIVSDGRNIIDYTYYLISSKELFEEEKLKHNFDHNVFVEFAK